MADVAGTDIETVVDSDRYGDAADTAIVDEPRRYTAASVTSSALAESDKWGIGGHPVPTVRSRTLMVVTGDRPPGVAERYTEAGK